MRAPIEVDVGLFELRDVEERLAESDPLLGWAVKYGIVLLDRDGTWASIVDAWRDRHYSLVQRKPGSKLPKRPSTSRS